MANRQLSVTAGFITIILCASAFPNFDSCHARTPNLSHLAPNRLDNSNQQGDSQAAKDDIVVTDHDDSYDNDKHEENFNYKYKNIGSKTINVAVTVKAQHSGYYEGHSNPPPFHSETYRFTVKPNEEHEVSGTWKIDKPSDEGDPVMQYGDDDSPQLLQATYSDNN